MSTRTERRKQIKDQDLRIKNVKQWEQEFLKLPRIIQALIIAYNRGVDVPAVVLFEAKETFPQYWNEKGEFEPIKLK